MVKNAYEVLGVKPHISLDELRIVYINLVKKYHPDNQDNKKGINEKMQEINEAYNELKKKLGTTNNLLDFTEYINKLEFYMKCSEKYQSYDYEFIKKIIDDAINRLRKSENNLNANLLYRSSVSFIKNYFEDKVLEYCRKYKLSFEDVNKKINYECSLNDLYQQLTKIKENYLLNQINSVEEELTIIMNNFKNHPNYKLVKNDIKCLMAIYLKKIMKDIENKQYYYEFIRHMIYYLVTSYINEDKDRINRMKKGYTTNSDIEDDIEHYIYIRRDLNDFYKDLTDQINWLSIKNDRYYMNFKMEQPNCYVDEIETERIIDLGILIEKYIPLNFFLDNATYIGKCIERVDCNINILYKFEDLELVEINGEIKVFKGKNLTEQASKYINETLTEQFKDIIKEKIILQTKNYSNKNKRALK